MLVLHVVDQDSIFGIPQGPPSLSGVIPEYHQVRPKSQTSSEESSSLVCPRGQGPPSSGVACVPTACLWTESAQ